MISLIKEIIGLLDKNSRKHAVFVLFVAIVFGAIELVGIGSLFLFMQVVLEGRLEGLPGYLQQAYAFVQPDSYRHFVYYVAAFTITTILVRNVAYVVQQYVQNNFVGATQVKISSALFSRYLVQDLEFFFANTANLLTKNLTQEVPRLVGNTIMSVITILSDSIILCVILGFLIFKEPMLVMTAFVVVLLFYLSIYRILRHFIQEKGKERLQVSDKYFGLIRQSIAGIREIKLYGAAQAAQKEFLSHAERQKYIFVMFNFYRQIPRQLIEVLLVIGVVAFVLMHYTSGSTEEMIVRLTLLAAAVYRLMPKVDSIMHGIISIKFDQSVFSLMKEHLSLPKANASEKLVALEKAIELKNVAYSYPEKPDVLAITPMSLSLVKGEVVGIQGESGAGKSTLLELLCNLIPAKEGELYVDGQVIKGRDAKLNIAYIPQKPSFFEGSIKKNIAFGQAENSIELARVKAAASIAGIAEFIETLPKRYEQLMGEDGNKLSGGQRQRVALARALYKDADIIILDEATNALDKATEKAFIERLLEAKGERTILMVSHNPDIMHYCDRVVRVNKGKVSEGK